MADVAWRLHFSVGVMTHTLLWGNVFPRMTQGLCTIDDREALLRRTVQFLAAGFSSPASNSLNDYAKRVSKFCVQHGSVCAIHAAAEPGLAQWIIALEPGRRAIKDRDGGTNRSFARRHQGLAGEVSSACRPIGMGLQRSQSDGEPADVLASTSTFPGFTFPGVVGPFTVVDIRPDGEWTVLDFASFEPISRGAGEMWTLRGRS